MADSTQIPHSLNDLGNVIRTIESESGQPSQLVVKVGDDKYLVGDLRKRVSEYRLEMQDEYNPNPFERGKKIKNLHKKLTGTYLSFNELKQAVEGTQSEPEIGSDNNPVYLIGSPDHGYSVAVLGMNMESAGGQTYKSIGRIIFPLLQNGEKVSVDKLKR